MFTLSSRCRRNLDRLRKNLAPFRWATAQPYAAGNVTREVPIYYNEKEVGWASIHDKRRLENLPCASTANVVRLDDWMQKDSFNRVDFIKLDIEGGELDALLGARRMLSEFHPMILAETRSGCDYEEVRQLLDATGYECSPFHADSIFGYTNALAVRTGSKPAGCRTVDEIETARLRS